MTDGDGRFLEVNDAYVSCSGYSRDELLDMSITNVEAQENRQETERHIAKIQHEGSDLFESLHRTKDGAVWPVEVNVSYWPGGGKVFTFLRDITARKAAERALRQWADAFEHCARASSWAIRRRT